MTQPVAEKMRLEIVVGTERGILHDVSDVLEIVVGTVTHDKDRDHSHRKYCM